MTKFNLNAYKKGILTLQIETLRPEKFINLLWENGIYIKKIKKRNVVSLIMEVNLKDYEKIKEVADKTRTKIKILDRNGIVFSFISYKKRTAFFIGSVAFLWILYVLSTFIWEIQVVTEHNVSPYEIRQQLKAIGITIGINKNKLDIKKIESSIVNHNENIMWVKVRTEGSKLRVDISERQIPPTITLDNTPCNLIARKDGQIIRVYTIAGTLIIKPGDIVKKGQLLVRGEQGKEGSINQVHANGTVIAKTYHEEVKVVPISGSERRKTGNETNNYYIQVNNKKIYLKNSRINYEKYEKKIDNSGFIKKESYLEEKDNKFNLDYIKVVEDTSNELYSKVIVNLDKSVKIVDKAVEYKLEENNCRVRILVTVEENIAVPDTIQP
ncbi:MAG: sporulation protein YqfD [Clostridiaceae bacterium]|nr:sporulation protein YqfD [Clostridiaceae bacterium]